MPRKKKQARTSSAKQFGWTFAQCGHHIKHTTQGDTRPELCPACKSKGEQA